MKTTTTTLCEIIEGQLGCDPVTAADLKNPDLLSELKADSLDLIELVMECEDQFGVSITDDEADQFLPSATGTTKPLSELVALIDAKKMGQAA